MDELFAENVTAHQTLMEINDKQMLIISPSRAKTGMVFLPRLIHAPPSPQGKTKLKWQQIFYQQTFPQL